MLEKTSFDDVQIAVYRGSRAIEIDSDPKTVCYSLQKQPEMLKTMNFHGVKIAIKQGSLHIEIVPEPQNKVL